MAKMVGVWIFVHPRSAQDNVKLTVGGTILMSEAEVRKLGVGLLPISIRIMDDDTFSDDLVHTDNNFFFAAHHVGPNSFTTEVTVPHGEVEDSEPWYESSAELYARVRGSGGGVTTSWANSQVESVRFD